MSRATVPAVLCESHEICNPPIAIELSKVVVPHEVDSIPRALYYHTFASISFIYEQCADIFEDESTEPIPPGELEKK